MPSRGRTRYESAGTLPHGTARRLRTRLSRSPETLGARYGRPSRLAEPKPYQTTPWFATPDDRSRPCRRPQPPPSPRRRTGGLGEMTSGTALAAHRSPADGRPVEVTTASRSLLRGGAGEGLWPAERARRSARHHRCLEHLPRGWSRTTGCRSRLAPFPPAPRSSSSGCKQPAVHLADESAQRTRASDGSHCASSERISETPRQTWPPPL